MNRVRAAVVGGSGYIGGELVRLLLQHPAVELTQVTSESQQGKFLHHVHPNLRQQTRLKFVSLAQLEACDVLFLALPHGMAQKRIADFQGLSERIIDLSSDFRLRDAQLYKTWYGHDHTCPEMLSAFVYGVPELHREAIAAARLVTGAGCLGNTPSLASHHPERQGAVRSFEPTGHRHTAEVLQELSGTVPLTVHFSATAIEMVRGVLTTAHVFLERPMSDKEIWSIYREAYKQEPFMRVVKERQGVYRYPEPKILSGANFCDVGFETDPHSSRVVVMCALDNLVKGGAGNGVQAMNCMLGLEETTGLHFPGLHPA
jgi:N-acetyl-gamma-glutamyl-phosphate/LysW-gamma-L-alpha-aminoadipyl-6-phosphate reductase